MGRLLLRHALGLLAEALAVDDSPVQGSLRLLRAHKLVMQAKHLLGGGLRKPTVDKAWLLACDPVRAYLFRIQDHPAEFPRKCPFDLETPSSWMPAVTENRLQRAAPV